MPENHVSPLQANPGESSSEFRAEPKQPQSVALNMRRMPLTSEEMLSARTVVPCACRLSWAVAQPSERGDRLRIGVKVTHNIDTPLTWGSLYISLSHTWWVQPLITKFFLRWGNGVRSHIRYWLIHRYFNTMLDSYDSVYAPKEGCFFLFYCSYTE